MVNIDAIVVRVICVECIAIAIETMVFYLHQTHAHAFFAIGNVMRCRRCCGRSRNWGHFRCRACLFFGSTNSLLITWNANRTSIFWIQFLSYSGSDAMRAPSGFELVWVYCFRFEIDAAHADDSCLLRNLLQLWLSTAIMFSFFLFFVSLSTQEFMIYRFTIVHVVRRNWITFFYFASLASVLQCYHCDCLLWAIIMADGVRMLLKFSCTVDYGVW